MADRVWLLAVFAASAAWGLTASPRLGAVFDEPIYQFAGLRAWRDGSPGPLLSLGVMPLPAASVSLPTYLYERSLGRRLDTHQHFQHEDFRRLLTAGRAVTLGWWLLLLAATMHLARQLGGAWAGRLAVLFPALDPTFLAHAGLATTDICVTACLTALAASYWAGRGRSGWWRVAVPGLWWGVCIAAKVSALGYGPAILMVLAAVHGVRASATWRAVAAAAGRAAADGVGIALIGLTVGLTLAEGGLGTGELHREVQGWIDSRKANPAAVRAAALTTAAPVYKNALTGIAFQWAHETRGCYVLGEWRPRPVWYFFPVALAVKLPPGPLLLWAGQLVAGWRRLLNPAALAAAGLLLLTPTFKVQIGVRLVLPLVALGYVGLAAAVAGDGPGRRVPRWLVLLALGWGVRECAVTWPDGLRYANPFWGGPAHVGRHLGDSNHDWGQGLVALAEWHAANGRPDTAVWYFGLDPAVHNDPFRPLPLENAADVRTAADLDRAVGDRVLAVSVSQMHLNLDQPPARPRVLALLRDRQPLAVLPTFVIYDFRSQK